VAESGLVLPPIRSGLIWSAQAATIARCDLGGDHPPGDRLATWQLPEPWRGPDDDAEPAAPDIPAIDADVDARVILSPGVSRGCDLRRPVADSVFDGTRAA
jgi:hypothetical protein